MMRRLVSGVLMSGWALAAQAGWSPFDYDNSQGGGGAPIPEAGIGVTGTINYTGQLIEGTKVTLGGLGAKEIDSPLLPTMLVVAGTLPAGTYYYTITALNASGETMTSAPKGGTIVAPGGLQLTWLPVIGAVGYKVYGRTASNSSLYMATVVAPTTTWTDDGSITPAGDGPKWNSTAPTIFPGTYQISVPALPDDSTVLDHVWSDGYHPISQYNWRCIGAGITYGSYPLYGISGFNNVPSYCNPYVRTSYVMATRTNNWTGVLVFKTLDNAERGLMHTGNDSTTGWRLRQLTSTSAWANQIDLRFDADGYAGGSKMALLSGACSLGSICAACFGVNADRVNLTTQWSTISSAQATPPFTVGADFHLGATSTTYGDNVTIYEVYFSSVPWSPNNCKILLDRVHARYPLNP